MNNTHFRVLTYDDEENKQVTSFTDRTLAMKFATQNKYSTIFNY